MTNEYKQLLRDEALQYGVHYFPYFQRKLENGNVNLKEHFQNDCKFDREFYEGIIYSNELVVDKIKDYRQRVFTKLYDVDATEAKMERYTYRLTEKIKRDFQKAMITFYLEKLEGELEDAKEELKYAEEDEVYYKERKYIGEEEAIGGPVSEKERLDNIQEAQEKQMKYGQKVSVIEDMQKELVMG